MNVVSSEFPLRTQNELTQILTVYNGSNDVEMILNYRGFDIRTGSRWIENRETNDLEATDKKKTDPPYYKLVKGSAFTVLHRKFIEYALTDQRAQDFLKWLEDTYSPDEMQVFYLSYW